MLTVVVDGCHNPNQTFGRCSLGRRGKQSQISDLCFLILTSLLPHSLQLVLLPVFIRSCDLHPVIGGSLLPSLLTPPSATVLSASSLIAVQASACDWSGNVDQPVNNPVIITVVIEPFASSYDPALILDVCLLSWVGQQPLFSFFFFHKRFGGGVVRTHKQL